MEASSHERKEVWYLSSAEAERNPALHIIRVGHTIAEPGYIKGPRVQAEFSLHFILQGALQFYYLDKCIQLNAGDLFILLKEHRIKYEMIPTGPPLQKVWIGMQGSQVDWLLKQLDLTAEQPYKRQVMQAQSKLLLQSILHAMKEQKDPDQLQLIGQFYQLLATCKPDKKLSDHANSPNWAEHAKNYIDTHYVEPITLDDVCKHVSISRGHFSEVFLHRFGISPSQYVKNLRMERAHHLVENTAYSITEIADSVGYQSLFSFSRAYRNHYGFSPNAARGKQ